MEPAREPASSRPKPCAIPLADGVEAVAPGAAAVATAAVGGVRN